MRNWQHIFPLLADAITAAFGGAIIGNWIGGSPMAIVTAIAGAVILIIYGSRAMNKERVTKKDPIQVEHQ